MKMKCCFFILLVCIVQHIVVANISSASTSSSCRNKYAQSSQCTKWVVSRYCTSTRWASWMKRNCALACGHCNCRDANMHCASWARKGECTRNPRYMLPNCLKSCGVCRPKIATKPATKPKPTPKPTTETITHPTTVSSASTSSSCRNRYAQSSRCTKWVVGRYCTSPKWASWMKRNCALACGHCNCRDVNMDCARLARNGECTRNPGYMLPNCLKSCGVCRTKTTKPATKPKPTPKPTTETVTHPTTAVQRSNQGSGTGCTDCQGNPIGFGSGSLPTTNAPSVVEKITSKSNDDDIKCGTRAVIGRIVGGTKAQPRIWPWQIGIKSKVCLNCMYFCGGTIVAKKWVITAAHCLENYRASDLHIDAGVTHQGGINKHKQSFNCTAIHTHQSYGISAPYDEDIAVLQLDNEVDFNDYVRPLCLNEKNLKLGKFCTVTGFGRTSENGPKSSYLQQVKVPIVAQDVCVNSYKNTKPPRNVTKNMFCAGYAKGQDDACAGDSGGPLTCWDIAKQRYVLGGIVSWGVGCARANHYGVYTDVEHLTAWITRITGNIH